MRRFPVAAAALALALAGCPLPQPLPTYPAGTVTPPRILAASTTQDVNANVGTGRSRMAGFGFGGTCRSGFWITYRFGWSVR